MKSIQLSILFLCALSSTLLTVYPDDARDLHNQEVDNIHGLMDGPFNAQDCCTNECLIGCLVTSLIPISLCVNETLPQIFFGCKRPEAQSALYNLTKKMN